MDFFIVYVALPALFYRIVAQDPVRGAGPTCRSSSRPRSRRPLAFALSFADRGSSLPPRPVPEATIAALAGGYGNIGYMGPGLALGDAGRAGAPCRSALIFCFDSLLFFAGAAADGDRAAATGRASARPARGRASRIALHPFIIATALGVISAALHFEPPVAIDRLMQFLQNAAAPCALFTLGVTVALRPIERVPWDVPALMPVKLLLHPLVMLLLLSALGAFDRDLGHDRGADGGAAAGAQRVHPGAAVRHLGRAGVRRGAARHAGLGRDADRRDVAGAARMRSLPLRTAPDERHRHDATASGLLVLDFTTLLPGPLATLMLAEAGAQVIKIERPGGDEHAHAIRRAGRATARAFALLNRGKKSLALDLKSEPSASGLAHCCSGADILVEQFRPGVMAAARLRLRGGAREPIHRIVYCSIYRLRPDAAARAAKPATTSTTSARPACSALAPGTVGSARGAAGA